MPLSPVLATSAVNMRDCPVRTGTSAQFHQRGLYDGECQICGLFGRVDDLSLCEECAGKLERDLIRQRDWDYSINAYGRSCFQARRITWPSRGAIR
jgi:hypothetical protein